MKLQSVSGTFQASMVLLEFQGHFRRPYGVPAGLECSSGVSETFQAISEAFLKFPGDFRVFGVPEDSRRLQGVHRLSRSDFTRVPGTC